MKNITRYKLELVKEKTSRYECPNRLNNPKEVASLINLIFELEKAAEEKMVMLCLDTKLGVIGAFEVSTGSLNASIVHPREIFKRAMLANAYSIIIAHNHPSGDVSPSSEDISVTKRLKEAGNLMGIFLIEHLIIGDNNNYTSLKERGYL